MRKLTKKDSDIRYPESLFQIDMAHVDILMEEDTCAFFELIRILGGKILATSVLGNLVFDRRMALQVGLQTVGHILALRNDAHARLHIF